MKRRRSPLAAPRRSRDRPPEVPPARRLPEGKREPARRALYRVRRSAVRRLTMSGRIAVPLRRIWSDVGRSVRGRDVGRRVPRGDRGQGRDRHGDRGRPPGRVRCRRRVGRRRGLGRSHRRRLHGFDRAERARDRSSRARRPARRDLSRRCGTAGARRVRARRADPRLPFADRGATEPAARVRRRSSRRRTHEVEVVAQRGAVGARRARERDLDGRARTQRIPAPVHPPGAAWTRREPHRAAAGRADAVVAQRRERERELALRGAEQQAQRVAGRAPAAGSGPRR